MSASLPTATQKRTRAIGQVRIAPESGRVRRNLSGLLWANSGHSTRIEALFRQPGGSERIAQTGREAGRAIDPGDAASRRASTLRQRLRRVGFDRLAQEEESNSTGCVIKTLIGSVYTVSASAGRTSNAGQRLTSSATHS